MSASVMSGYPSFKGLQGYPSYESYFTNDWSAGMSAPFANAPVGNEFQAYPQTSVPAGDSSTLKDLTSSLAALLATTSQSPNGNTSNAQADSATRPLATEVAPPALEAQSQSHTASATKLPKRRFLSKYRAAPGRLTTLMMRHVPCRFSQDDMMALLDKEGFANKYDFIHMPSNSSSNLGYGFINFIEPEDASACMKTFTGYKFPGTQSVKVCDVQLAHIQGLENNIKHFHRTSAKKIMLRKPFIRGQQGDLTPTTAPSSPKPESPERADQEVPVMPSTPPASVSCSSVEVVPVTMSGMFTEFSVNSMFEDFHSG
jgi:hypothetical protein